MSLSTEIWILAIVLTGITAAFALFPFLERDSGPDAGQAPRGGTRRQQQALDTLWAEKLRVLRAIRDLDFDYDLGKLPDSTYAAQRVALIRLYAAIAARIDDLEADVFAQQSRIDAAVAAYRQTH